MAAVRRRSRPRLRGRLETAAARPSTRCHAVGALLSAAAAFWFSAIDVDTGYWLHLAPAMFILGLGFVLGVLALTQAAVYRVDPDKAGIASVLLKSTQQIGVALGLAVLAGSPPPSPPTRATPDSPNDAHRAGYSTAMIVAAGILLTDTETAR